MITCFVTLARNAVAITERCQMKLAVATRKTNQLVQNTDHCDHNPDRALAQFQSNHDDYSELFGKCGYFNIESINKMLFYKNKDDLFIIHLNIRSLQKNVETLNNYFSQLDKQPDIIVLSETKLDEGRVFANIKLDGYKFNYVNGLTNAGGVGLYVKERIKFSANKCVQCDLSFVETLWINVTFNDSSAVVGTVYRHPRSGPRDIEKFCESMQDIFDILNKKKRPFYIMGDFNIDQLKISKKKNIRQYANMLLGSMCKCLIDLPTRVTSKSKSLIDHIYTNDIKHRINSGILVSDISDHFPVFAKISKMKSPSNQVDNYYVRDMKKFDHKNFLVQLDNQLSLVRNSFCTKSVNEQFDQIVSTLSEVADIHAPLRKATRKKKTIKTKTLDYSRDLKIYRL